MLKISSNVQHGSKYDRLGESGHRMVYRQRQVEEVEEGAQWKSATGCCAEQFRLCELTTQYPFKALAQEDSSHVKTVFASPMKLRNINSLNLPPPTNVGCWEFVSYKNPRRC